MTSSFDPVARAAIFKAYDIRGTVPEQLDAELAYRVGNAFAAVMADEGQPGTLVIGHDMRPSSPELADAFARGATEAGLDVVLIGLTSTDELYFAAGHLGVPGAMLTASHNPARYNGIKLCRAFAVPVGMETGLATIRDLAVGETRTTASTPGSVTRQDLLGAYVSHLLSLAPLSPSRRLKVVADAGNGMAGLTAPAVFAQLPGVDLTEMYFELDGTFPNHEANPIEPENVADLAARVVTDGADVGLAFDGDADRCFIVDELGRAVEPSAITGLIASRMLASEPGATIIWNLITSRAVPQLVTELGGTPYRSRVGHSFIKADMATTGAIFGGEHSGHFYFREFWRADSGMLAALHVLAALSETDVPLSELLAPYHRYPASGEINTVVDDQPTVLADLRTSFGALDGMLVDELDGITFEHAEWRVNVRASNTEPLLRLNVEGNDRDTMERVRDQALAIIRRTA